MLITQNITRVLKNIAANFPYFIYCLRLWQFDKKNRCAASWIFFSFFFVIISLQLQVIDFPEFKIQASEFYLHHVI